MSTKLILFPDTNLFLQGKALREIDWTLLGNFDVVELVVTRPVQSEIDKHKGRGSGRVSNRARAASSLFGAALNQPDNTSIVHGGKPEVRLVLNILEKPSKRLAEQLNYDERDDQLVGIAAAYRDAHPGRDARVLTHDIGPRASAMAVDVPCEAIPDSWLLAPETDEGEKRIKAVEAELNATRRLSP